MNKYSTESCDAEQVYYLEGENFSRLVIIELNALRSMRSCRQLAFSDHESGGVLIGERRGKSIIVKRVTTPFSGDSSSRCLFIRNDVRHQISICDANKESDGSSNYIGEWHTHPEDNPYPSAMDFSNWMKCLNGYDTCLVAVVGRHKEWFALYENGKFHDLLLMSDYISNGIRK